MRRRRSWRRLQRKSKSASVLWKRRWNVAPRFSLSLHFFFFTLCFFFSGFCILPYITPIDIVSIDISLKNWIEEKMCLYTTRFNTSNVYSYVNTSVYVSVSSLKQVRTRKTCSYMIRCRYMWLHSITFIFISLFIIIIITFFIILREICSYMTVHVIIFNHFYFLYFFLKILTSVYMSLSCRIGD